MVEKVVFISHVNEDAELAVRLKDLIEDSVHRVDQRLRFIRVDLSGR